MSFDEELRQLKQKDSFYRTSDVLKIEAEYKAENQKLEDKIKDLDSRLVYLEEQESTRARAEHQHEEYLDWENAEGLSRV